MNTVVLYGITGGFVADEIKQVLSHYGVISVCGDRIEEYGNSADFLVVECATRARVKVKKGIVVMIGDTGKSCVLEIPENFLGVVFSSDTAALKVLMNKKIKTVTCGMSNEDTLILSSIKENTASVCLQRKLTTLSGKIVEPREYPVKLQKKITDYALLAAFSILLLCDVEPGK